jgi:glycerophosphoryl diester phosphodiesterase
MGIGAIARLWAAAQAPGLIFRRSRYQRIAQVPMRQGRITVVDRKLIAAARQRGIEVHVWTVDEPEQMHQLLDLGVDGLMTDRPDVLKNVLRERGGWSSTR